MSVHLKNTIKKLIKENNGTLSLDEIIILLKNMPEYQRTKIESLKPTIKKFLQETKKEKEKLKEKQSEKDLISETSQSFLNKKRNPPKNNSISSLFPSQNTFNPEKFIYKPTIKLSSLGGMTEIIKRIKELIRNPLDYYEAYKELNTLPITGILLCGPPGCGKTTLAYSIGGEFQIPFYKITGPDIISSLSGESEQIIRNLFNSVIENAPSILFIDEIETILQKVNRILFSDTGDGGVIGDYKILEMIGKGGFGSVYKVENIKEKTQFAMKMVKLEPEQIKYFKEHKSEMYKAINEIRIWKKFNHPNIIFYDNSFLIKENCYIIMELVEGLSLGEYISYLKDNNRKMEKELVIKIILQIVSGLRYMHKKANVIFRDLNPNNIMLDYSYNVKLIDFGLTVEEGKTKKVSTILNQSVQFVFEGSVMYSSPEVMKNEIISYESDIWALGCIIYEMIKLTPPFTGDNSLTVANNVCEGTYVKLKENDFENKEIIKLVENCLVVDMQKRYNIDNVCQLLGPFLFDYFSEIKDI